MVEIKTKYEGSLVCTATHTPSGKSFKTDAPVDNKGKGASFSPTDLLATSLGVCYLTTMGIAAEERGINMKGTTCRVEKHMSEDKPRRVARLVAEIVFPEGIPLHARGILEAVALHCPVSKSIHPDIDVDVRLHFSDGQDMSEHTHKI
ncbi:MAG TPA: OsmC family protein [Ignavibacteria bacterium]|nr:OsmC family protein [Ignavibacteria bacterium]